MKKYMLAKKINLLILAGLILLLTACSGQPNSDDEALNPAPVPAPEPEPKDPPAPVFPQNTQLVFRTQPSNTVAGQEIAPIIEIQDLAGNLVSNGPDATTMISLSLASGSGNLLGTLSISAVAGVADFTGLAANIDLMGTKILEVSKFDTSAAGGSPAVTQLSANFEILPTPAASLNFVTQAPDPTNVAQVITPEIEILDGFGNRVTSGPDASAAITLNLQSGTGPLLGNLTINASNGLASYSLGDAVLLMAAGNKVLRANKADTTGSGGSGSLFVDSNTFSVSTIPAPTALSLVSPVSSPANDDTPEIQVDGVENANTVRIFSDNTCTTEVASGNASSSSVTLTLNPPLSPGSYTFYANREDASSNVSACSTVSLSYELDLTAPNLATGLTLATNYSNSTSTAPLFTWIPSTSPDLSIELVALGTSAGGQEVLAFESPDSSNSHTFDSLSLSECSGFAPIYWPSVQSTDTAGNSVIATHSTGFLVDTIAPIMTGIPFTSGDAAADRSATAFWIAATEACGIQYYEFAIGTSPGDQDIVPYTNIGNTTSYQAVNGVDGLSLSISNGVYYFTSIRAVDMSGKPSNIITSNGWRFVQAPDAINDLGFSGRTSSSVAISWTAPNDNGAAISDYIVQYKENSSSTWLSFNEGTNTNTNTNANVTGLNASTVYDFRVIAFNGANSAASNIVTQETAPNDPFFDPSVFTALNNGGATRSRVVAMDDNTTVNHNGSPLPGSPINAGEYITFNSARGDILTADKPIFVAGRLAVANNNTQEGNIVWMSPDWAGKEFITVGSRDRQHVITVYAFETTEITIYEGATIRVNADEVTAGNFATYRMNNDAGYRIVSTKDITAYQYSEGNGDDKVVDNLPILPPATDIIGIPSRSGQYTTLATSANYNWYESDGSSGSDSVNQGVFDSFGGNGAQYGAPAARVISSALMIGRSNADNDGNDSSPFVPINFQKKRFVINHDTEWVAFASDQAANIQIFRPGQAQTSLTLSRSGSGALTPYHGRLTNVPEGTIFESNTRFQTWYETEANPEDSAANEDETILFGHDGVGLPVNHKLKLWLDAADPNTLFQADDCTSIVSVSGESIGCWRDKSLQENHATQSGINKPTYAANVSAFANAPAIQFNGGANYLEFAQSIVEGNNYTIFALVHRDDNSGNNYFIGTQSAVANAGLHFGFSSDSNLRLGQISNDLDLSVSGQAQASIGLLSARLSASGKQVSFNGFTNSDAVSTPLASAGQGVIGRGFDSGGFSGQIAEIIVFSRALSDDEMNLMSDYLRKKWLRPTLLANLRLWLDASDLGTLYTDTGCSNNVSAPGNAVQCWTDKSGNGYQAIQAQAGSTYQVDSAKDTVQLNNSSFSISGSGSGAVFNDGDSLDQVDVFAVMKSANASETGYLLHHPAGAGFSVHAPISGNAQISVGGNSLSAAWGADTSNYFRWNFISDNLSASQEIFRNDNSVTSDGNTGSISIGTENFYIGAENGSTNNQNANIGSILVFDRKLSVEERHFIRSYLDSE